MPCSARLYNCHLTIKQEIITRERLYKSPTPSELAGDSDESKQGDATVGEDITDSFGNTRYLHVGTARSTGSAAINITQHASRWLGTFLTPEQSNTCWPE